MNVSEYINNAYNSICKSFRDYFAEQEFQAIINRECNAYEKIYVKSHIIKTINIYASILLLNENKIGARFIDESKILLRSLYEHVLNLIYIWLTANESEREKKINQFYDYAKNVLPYLYYTEQLNELEQVQIRNEIQEELFQEICEIKEETNFDKRIKEHKEKYNLQKLSTWHGLGQCKFYEFIIDNWAFGDNSRKTFKKVIKESNPYVHCNIILYIDETGAITENINPKNCFDVIFLATILFIGYIEIIIHILSIKKEENKYLNNFFKRADEIKNIQKNDIEDIIYPIKVRIR